MTSLNILLAVTHPAVVFVLGMATAVLVGGWLYLAYRLSRRGRS